MRQRITAWQVEELTMRKAKLADEQRLKEICRSWKDKAFVEGHDFDEAYIQTSILDPTLPPIPNATKQQESFMVIETKEQIVGFFDCYYGYPKDDCVWIGMFLIDHTMHNQQIGSKVIQSLLAHCKREGWNQVALAVYLKNWTGLRFWINNGFTQIDKYAGDKLYSSETYAMLVLSQMLL